MTARILIAGFKHETHSFSRLPTTLDDYRARALLYGAELDQLRGTATEIAGFLDACDEYGWEPVNAVFADATPSGKVSRDAFDHVSDCIVKTAQECGPIDGMLLCLHGAMVCEHELDGEGALLRRIRQELGRDLTIAATHDLHANVSDEFASWVDILVSYRTYPHIDQYEVARQAGELMARALAGEITPRVRVARNSMIAGLDHGRTTSTGPMTELLDLAKAWTLEHRDLLSMSINAGFSRADTPETGPSVVMVTNGDCPAGNDLINESLDHIWSTRHVETVKTLTLDEVVEILRDGIAGSGPVVIADYADNPGGGGYGDSTDLLRALLEAGITGIAFANMMDEETTRAAHEAGVGSMIDVQLGGKLGPEFGGPIAIKARVRALTDGRFQFEGPMLRGQHVDMGPTAVLEADGLEVVVTGKRFQSYDPMFFKHAGIEPTTRDIIVVKSAQHFRAAFGPLSRCVLVVDSGGGLTTDDLSKFSYQHIPRPAFPLDTD